MTTELQIKKYRRPSKLQIFLIRDESSWNVWDL